jgi:hypothetical protein
MNKDTNDNTIIDMVGSGLTLNYKNCRKKVDLLWKYSLSRVSFGKLNWRAKAGSSKHGFTVLTADSLERIGAPLRFDTGNFASPTIATTATSMRHCCTDYLGLCECLEGHSKLDWRRPEPLLLPRAT